MTPKEKANQLFNAFGIYDWDERKGWEFNILNTKANVNKVIHHIVSALDWHEFEVPNKEYEYWKEVKKEIENL
jgi:hypothetical protein